MRSADDILSRDLTDLIACCLHYQERGESDYTSMTAAEIAGMWNPVPDAVKQRYWNEPKFHMQVDRAVAGAMMLVTKARLHHQPGGRET